MSCRGKLAPVNGKVQGITERLRPGNLRELRSFQGALYQLNKIVAELADFCATFISILKREAEWE